MSLLNKDNAPILVDDNPIQIADVKTVVEQEGTLARRGTDIDVMDFMHQSGTSIQMGDLIDTADIISLIDEEIERMDRQTAK